MVVDLADDFWAPRRAQLREPLPGLPTVPYHRWANRGPTTMRYRFPRA